MSDTSAVCPVCDSHSTVWLASFTAEESAEHFIPYSRDESKNSRVVEIIRAAWKSESCDVLRCDDCRFCFPIPYVPATASFYDLWLDAPYHRADRWDLERARDFVLSNAKGQPRILEIGAGIGEFLVQLRNDGRLCAPRFFATDYSGYSIDRLRKLGFWAERADVYDLVKADDLRHSFDFVCAFQTIEHMAPIVDVFEAIKQLLRPGGYLCISVPNGDQVEFDARYLGWWSPPPNHVAVWYRESFEAVARRTGLTLIRHEAEPLSFRHALRHIAYTNINGLSLGKTGLAVMTNRIRYRRLRRFAKAVLGSGLALPKFPLARHLNSGPNQIVLFQLPEV